MTKHVAALPNLRLEAESATALHRQLYDGLRLAILAGQLTANTRLPSSRALAHELGISRNTVLDAYSQLLAEGYLESRAGSGTFVARALPDPVIRLPARTAAWSTPMERSPSRRGQLLMDTPVSS